MEFRRLFKTDAEQLFSLRLRALASAPTAFGVSVEDEQLRGRGFFENILSQSADDNVIFGAISEGTVVGMVGILRTERAKTHHKANIWGGCMWTPPKEARVSVPRCWTWRFDMLARG